MSAEVVSRIISCKFDDGRIQ